MKYIPSVDKLFGFSWIVCWFIGIWVYHVQFFLTGLFCFCLAYILNKSGENTEQHLPAFFTMDKNARTLTVQRIYEDGLKWEDNEVCSGDAFLPSGEIKVGDAVLNCSGNVAIRHIPSNKILGAFNFK